MEIKKLRDVLIEENKMDFYNDILIYMRNPKSLVSEECIKYIKEKGYYDIFENIGELFKNNKNEYRRLIYYGQAIMWENMKIAFENLTKIKEEISNAKLVYFDDDYLRANKEVADILSKYAKAKAVISKMENNLSVDRYLDHICEDEFNIIIKLFDDIHRLVDFKLSKYKEIYIEQWDNSNICKIMLHKLIKSDMSNEICSLFRSKRKHVILFIIDGLGYGQYLWSKEVVPLNKNFFYSDNIFKWLSDEKLIEEYILAAPLITDTAAGLCQIYTGERSNKTRVFASNIKKEGSPNFISVKSEDKHSFRKIANVDTESFTVDISSECESMKVYYCSKYDDNRVSGFSDYIFDGAEIKSIIPPERVFSILREDCSNIEKGATVVYITSIDNSGHIMGSFSQFERYEHEKLNSLLRNFLIETAKFNPEIFNGETSILITADHGMTESYRISVSRYEINNQLHKINAHSDKIIEANRALFLYDVTGNIESCKNILKDYFEKRKIEVNILSKGDKLFDMYMPIREENYEYTTPDIAILLISEGIFYSKEVSENLMHFGGHGGHSIDEVFVPALEIELNNRLIENIKNRFLKF